jgi:Na+/proline symporter
MFAMIAAKVKQNANGATTFLQIVKARYGTACHLLFTFYALVCFHVVSGSLVLGCAATVNALTGVPVLASCFLLPIGIAVYVIAGGLRATFLVDWMHTMVRKGRNTEPGYAFRQLTSHCFTDPLHHHLRLRVLGLWHVA